MAPRRAVEHRLRRLSADLRLGSRPRDALTHILPLVETYGDPAVLGRTDRIAVIAGYVATPHLSRSLVTLVEQFEENGYVVVVVLASATPDRPIWPEGRTAPSLIVTKPNVGYDFGSWATALHLYPHIAEARHVILCNDSLLGPFASLAPMIHDFENSWSDVWGATDTTEFTPHLQSYLLGFTGGVLRHPAVLSFWRHIRDIADKDAIVVRYEIGLSRLLEREGFVSVPWFRSEDIVPEGGNPTTIGGSRLLEAGFPFVKRILMDNPDVFPDCARARHVVALQYSQDVDQWR
ncbi:conserved protein of unknown function [Agreia sp. COWG]|nr:conserved protein of unknown function [Agreia sp. COWG]